MIPLRILFAACIMCCSLYAEAEKPNIILYFADDISARELPLYGSSVWTAPDRSESTDPKYLAKTPVIDRLAEEGAWIKTAWSATVCSPARAMMMTGRYAHLHKWWDVSGERPNDLLSYDQIKDWSKVLEVHREERKRLEHAVEPFDLFITERDAPGTPPNPKRQKSKKK